MRDLQIGDLIQTASFAAKFWKKGEKKAALTASFSAGRGSHFTLLLLGKAEDGTDPDPDILLNRLGWVFDEDRANEQLAERLKARHEEV